MRERSRFSFLKGKKGNATLATDNVIVDTDLTELDEVTVYKGTCSDERQHTLGDLFFTDWDWGCMSLFSKTVHLSKINNEVPGVQFNTMCNFQQNLILVRYAYAFEGEELVGGDWVR